MDVVFELVDEAVFEEVGAVEVAEEGAVGAVVAVLDLVVGEVVDGAGVGAG